MQTDKTLHFSPAAQALVDKVVALMKQADLEGSLPYTSRCIDTFSRKAVLQIMQDNAGITGLNEMRAECAAERLAEAA